MPNLKQRLENLEKSAGHGPGTHEEFILYCMEHGPSDAEFSAVTDEDTDAFLRGTPNEPEQHHANT